MVRRLTASLVVACALIGVIVLQACSSSSGSSSGNGECIEPAQHLVAKERREAGGLWRMTATIRNNGSCDFWLLGIKAAPFGGRGPTWKGGWGIPAGGSLSSTFPISGQDLAGDGERSFSGITGGAIREIEVTTSDGGAFIIHPKLVEKRLRKRYVWLRHLRYFVRYSPLARSVMYVRVRNATGKVVYKGRGVNGVFESP